MKLHSLRHKVNFKHKDIMTRKATRYIQHERQLQPSSRLSFDLHARKKKIDEGRERRIENEKTKSERSLHFRPRLWRYLEKENRISKLLKAALLLKQDF